MMVSPLGGANYGVDDVTEMMTSPRESHSPGNLSATFSDSSSSPSSPQSQQRGNVSKECGVCRDVAKSMHFGGRSCDSCKAFFRRSVQQSGYMSFSCPYDRECVIGISSRKSCQYCRFAKCVSIGMEKSWVMSEDERRKMSEERKSRKVRPTGINSNHSAQETDEESSMYSLSEEDRKEISGIVSTYRTAYKSFPYENTTNNDDSGPKDPTKEVFNPWLKFCQRMAKFFTYFKDFTELSNQDQKLLLTTAITSAGIIIGAVSYDSASCKWGKFGNSSYKGYVPSVSAQSVEKLVPGDLFSRLNQFFKKFQNICTDETMAYILIMVSLYSPELMGLEAKEHIQSLQERYIHMLQNYVKYKFRERSSIVFPKAIVSLADIRELADRTSQIKIRQAKQNPEAANSMLLNIMNISPIASLYPEISLPPSSPVKLELYDHVTSGEAKNGPHFNKFLNFMVQSDKSHQNLLPVIVDFLKELSISRRQNMHSNRAIAGTSTRRSGRYSRVKNQSNLNKKKERRAKSAQDHQQSISVKEEVVERVDDCYSPLPMSPAAAAAATNIFPTTTPVTEYMETYPPQTHYISNHQQSTMASIQPSINESQSTPIAHHAQHQLQPIYHTPTADYSHHQQADLISSGVLQYEESSSPVVVNTTQTYLPPILSEENSYHQLQQSDIMTLQMPPVSPFPSPLTVCNPSHLPHHHNHQQQQLSPDPFGQNQALSPYASSTSSSSPEEVVNESKELNINDADIKILMDLMEKVGELKNFENNEALLKEVLSRAKSTIENNNDYRCYEEQPQTNGCVELSVMNGSAYSSEMEIDASLIEEESY